MTQRDRFLKAQKQTLPAMWPKLDAMAQQKVEAYLDAHHAITLPQYYRIKADIYLAPVLVDRGVEQ